MLCRYSGRSTSVMTSVFVRASMMMLPFLESAWTDDLRDLLGVRIATRAGHRDQRPVLDLLLLEVAASLSSSAACRAGGDAQYVP